MKNLSSATEHEQSLSSHKLDRLTDQRFRDPEESSTEETSRIYGGVGSSALPLPHPSRPLSRKSPEETTVWSPSTQNLLDQPPSSFPRSLIMGGMAFFLAFGSWAWFGTVEEVGKAQGKLVPQGETYKIEPIELGKVSRLAVKEGDTVQAGQILLELDDSLVKQEIERLRQSLTAAQMELYQTQNLQSRLELERQAQEAISSAEISAQKAAIDLTKEKIATSRQIQSQLQTTAIAYQRRQQQLQPISAIAQDKLTQLQAEEAAHQARIARLIPLEEEGALSQEFIFQAEQALRDTQQRIKNSQLQEVNSANEQLFQVNQSLRDLQSQLTENQGQLATHYRELERLQAELTRQQADAQRLQLETLQKIQQFEVQITQIKAKIADINNNLKITQKKLQHKYLKAPVSGVVMSLNLKNTGEVIEAGQTVAEIAPHGVPLVLSAVVPNQEAGFVEEGMPVQIKLDAYPYQDYGIISGEVAEISADSQTHEQQGTTVYQVEIKLDRDHVKDNQQLIPFKAGQTATADIIIRRRRIIDVLLDPIKQIQQDGIKL